jgi:hypothetical protein
MGKWGWFGNMEGLTLRHCVLSTVRRVNCCSEKLRNFPRITQLGRREFHTLTYFTQKPHLFVSCF